MKHTREQILARFAETDEFVIELDDGDTAWDPETGDTLLGPAYIEFFRGSFPGTALRANVIPS